MTLKPGTRLGAYEIVAPMGAGGMGEVYRARDPKLGRDVALKILPADLARDPDRATRFTREAQVLAALSHPHIGAIYGLEEAGPDGDRDDLVQFLLLELVDGDTLARLIDRKRGTGLPLEQALTIACQIADAVGAAHEKGVIHRDLKPDNVMLRPDGIAKVLDFGLAKLTDARGSDVLSGVATIDHGTTVPGTVMGTARYMSPEQARGEVVDARSDIFSFGILLYEMVAGRSPFDGASGLDAISRILKSEPPPLRTAAAHAPAELQRMVSKALRKDRDERYQSMKELSLDLKSLQQDLQFEAKTRDGSGAGIARRPAVQRFWWAAIAMGAIALTIAGLGIWFSGRGDAIESVAVLPLVNATNDPALEYLSDGITESLINSLSQIPQVKVMSRNSVFRLKGRDADAREVGRLLGVRGVLTGRLARRGDALAVSLELTDAADNSQIWGHQYDGRLADVFTLQESMTRDITDRMRVRLTGPELQQLAKRPTENIKAFEYYMQSRAFAYRRTREDLLTAVQLCEKAIGEDPDYALAYAGLADAFSSLGIRAYIPPIEGRRKSEDAARKAVSLDDRLGEAHLAVSQVHVMFAPYDFSLVERAIQRALALNPSLAMAHNYLAIARNRQGRFDEAAAEMAKARELDPLSPILARASAISYFLKRDYAQARDILHRADSLGPQFIIPIEIGVYIENGLFDEALAGLERAKRQRAGDSMLLFQTGLVYAAQGKRQQALDVVAALEAVSGDSLSQAHWIAKIYAGLRETDLAFSWLDRGLAVNAIGDFYRDEPVWDSIRADQRFAGFERRISNAR